MKILDRADWVPEDVVAFWNIFFVTHLEMVSQGCSQTLSDIDLKKILPEERPNVLAMIENQRRTKSFGEVGPRLFQQFEIGPRPQALWDKVTTSKYYIPTEFLCAVKDAYIGDLSRLEIMTPAEKKKWPDEVAMAAYRLGSLVSGTDADKLVSEHCGRIKSEVFQILEEYDADIPQEVLSEIGSIFMDREAYLSLNILMYELGKAPEKTRRSMFDQMLSQPDKFDPKLLSPKADNAHRTYFIRSMTDFFYRKSNQPERGLVQTLVFALFEEDIDIRQITQIAPTQ